MSTATASAKHDAVAGFVRATLKAMDDIVGQPRDRARRRDHRGAGPRARTGRRSRRSSTRRSTPGGRRAAAGAAGPTRRDRPRRLAGLDRLHDEAGPRPDAGHGRPARHRGVPSDPLAAPIIAACPPSSSRVGRRCAAGPGAVAARRRRDARRGRRAGRGRRRGADRVRGSRHPARRRGWRTARSISGRGSCCRGWSTSTRTCRSCPNAGLGFALDLLTWLDRLTFPTERSWADPAVAAALSPAIFRAFAAAGTTTVHGLRRRLRGGDGRGVPGGRGARDPGDPRQGDDGSGHVRPDDRAVDDPRAVAARVGGR